MNNYHDQYMDAATYVLNLVAHRSPRLIFSVLVLLIYVTQESKTLGRFATLASDPEVTSFRQMLARIQNNEHVVSDAVLKQLETLSKAPDIRSFLTDESSSDVISGWLFDEPIIWDLINQNREGIIAQLIEPRSESESVSRTFLNALRTQMANMRASQQRTVDLSALPPVTPNSALRVRIFVASTGEVAEEAEHVEAIAREFNTPYSGMASRLGLTLEIVAWHLASPGGGLAQHEIDLQLQDIDLLIGILWKRFGMPSGMQHPGWKADKSGTEWELRSAYQKWLRTGFPWIMMYRSTRTPENIDDIDLPQLAMVKEFMLNFHAGGEMPALYVLYKTPSDFKDRLRQDLAQILPYVAFRRRS